jgi:acyl-coenzyme A synthetase/AMP-(fatty) acid ligase
MVEHRAVCNRIAFGQQTCPLSNEDAMLQAAPSCFDASVWEIFTPLAAGARLVLTAEDGHSDPTHLVRTMIEHGVTTAGFVPTMLRLLLDEPDFGECRRLRWVLAGGEALPAEVETLFRERLPDAELHNFYGLTETTVDATSWHCTGGTCGATVPIGYPIGNVEAYVLDPRGQPLPVGIPGELHIGGACLARGYVHRPDLTAERFVSYPCGAGGSRVRVYKTGDLVRRLPDGALEFLGRLDRQLKLGGVRIDPQEIEAQLRQLDVVADALVVADHQRLVAYVVARPETQVIPAEVRAVLRERLPSILVPSAIIPIARWPLTNNGKIDRAALPSVADFDLPAAADGAPLTGFEEIVGGVWRDVLGVPGVGRHENFFDVGGHSLLLLQVRSRLCAMLGSQIPLVEMFRHPTIGSFAAWLGSQDVGAPAIAGVVERAERQRAFFERARWAGGRHG